MGWGVRIYSSSCYSYLLIQQSCCFFPLHRLWVTVLSCHLWSISSLLLSSQLDRWVLRSHKTDQRPSRNLLHLCRSFINIFCYDALEKKYINKEDAALSRCQTMICNILQQTLCCAKESVAETIITKCIHTAFLKWIKINKIIAFILGQK